MSASEIRRANRSYYMQGKVRKGDILSACSNPVFVIDKSEAKAEDPVDWSFAVLELLREQGWDVKEMNDR